MAPDYNDPEENYYIRLGLDPDVDDWAVIEDRIRERKRIWSQYSLSGTSAQRAEAQDGQRDIANMAKALRDAPTRRRHAGGARTILASRKRKQLDALEKRIDTTIKAEVCDVAVVSVLGKQVEGAITESEVKDLLAHKGIVVVGPAPELLDATIATRIQKLLKFLKKRDLYDFLTMDPGAACEDLNAKATRRLKDLRKVKKGPEIQAGMDIASECLEMFRDDGKKKRYDNSLVSQGMDETLVILVAVDGKLSAMEIETAVQEAEKAGIGRRLALEYIGHYKQRREASGTKLEVTWPQRSAASAVGPGVRPAPVAPAIDRSALEVLYDATGGPTWTERDKWKSSAPLGEWYGVTTDAAGRVTGLELQQNALSGAIPSTLGNLTHLEDLNLTGNALSGAIPSTLGNLTHLKHLSLTGNALSGPIPPALARWVKQKDLVSPSPARARWPVYAAVGAVLIIGIALRQGSDSPVSAPQSTSPAPVVPAEADGSAPGRTRTSQVGVARRAEAALNLDRAAWRRIQGGLVAARMGVRAVDGIPGDATRAAVRRWQRARGRAPTGYLSASEAEALGGAAPSSAPRDRASRVTGTTRPDSTPDPPRSAAAPEAEALGGAPSSAPRDRASRVTGTTRPGSAPDPPRSAVAPSDPMADRAASLVAEAQRGEAQAQTDVALLYARGSGVEQSYTEALRWLREAAGNNQSDAAMHLALMYAAGESVSRNRDQALYWFREFLRLSGHASNAPGSAEQFDAVIAATEEAYADLTRDYLKRWTALSMEPTRVRLTYSGNDPDPVFRRAGRELRNASRQNANNIRDRRVDWTLPGAVRSVLNRGALAQRQRSPDVRRDAVGYLVDQMRNVMSTEGVAANDDRYQSSLRAIDARSRRFDDLIENRALRVGAIKVDAEPRDATVFIDGERYGTVDDMDDEEGRIFLAGRRTIRVSRDGYQTHEESIDLRPRERYLIRGSLERARRR